MNIFEPQFAWFVGSAILLAIWIALYAAVKDRGLRRAMLGVSLWTSLLGLTEPVFVPRYWNPPSLFNLASRTGFDIESLIFSFAIGGIAVVLYELLFRAAHEPMTTRERSLPRHRYHLWAFFSGPIAFAILWSATPLNPIYSAIFSMGIGGAFALLCRPDLLAKMLASAAIFFGLYFAFFLAFTALYPGYVERVWNLEAVSGILIAGVPLEELLFAASFGFVWSSVYEHFMWRKLKKIS